MLRSLRFRLSLLLILAASTTLAAFGFYGQRKLANELNESFRSRQVGALARIAQVVAVPLWEFNADALANILRAQLATPDIEALQVQDDDGSMVAAFERDERGAIVAVSGVGSGNELIVDKAIHRADRPTERIGRLVIRFTRDDLDATIRSNAYQLVLQVLAVNVVLIVLLLASLRIVFRPLAELRTALMRLAEQGGGGRAITELQEGRYEELAGVTRGFNLALRKLRSLAEQLSHYLSPQIYRAIFEGAHEGGIRASRKKLTIFFSDIKDFTQTTENMEPEDLTYLLNKYFSEMSKIALEHGATVDKFVGDAMLMFLGDPSTRGVREDALQCVRMAVAMQRRMADLQDVWREKGYDKPFHMRVGINTGFCNVGNFGSNERMDYTIIGGEVNLAARLQQLGEPNGVMLSYETYALVRDEFEAEERPPLQAKGMAREIRCFALKDVLTANASDRKFLVKDAPGLRLTLNLDQVNGKTKGAVLARLEEALDRVRRHA